jgi:NADP-dependent 3-hydroxy acid dehydrogenase YdfG
MENTLAKWGRVDILVNNAGTSYKNKVCIVIFDTLKEQDVNGNLAKRTSYGR